MNSSSYEKCFQEYNDAIKRLWKPVFENITIPTKKTNVEFKQFCFHVNQDESPIWFFGMNPAAPSLVVKTTRPFPVGPVDLGLVAKHSTVFSFLGTEKKA